MKKTILFSLSMVLVLLVNNLAYASILTDPVFDSNSAYLDSTKSVDFSAETFLIKSCIKVTSVKLYKYNGNSWNYVCDLAAPTKEATNTNMYGANKNYASSIGTGTFRVLVTFYADGYTASTYSNARSF